MILLQMKKLLLFFIFLNCSLIATAQTIIYVDSAATGSNNGNNWVNAYTDLQSAIDRIHLFTNNTTTFEVRLAKGTYQPSKKYGNFYAYVFSRGGIKLYGGYNASNGSRDILSNQTVLDGGTLGTAANDVQNTRTEHLLVIAGITVLANAIEIDGLTFTGGTGATYQNDDHPSFTVNGLEILAMYGGAIYLSEVGNTITINRCKFLKNYAARGGAIYTYKSNPTVNNCLFVENSIFVPCSGFQCLGTVFTTLGGAVINESGKLVINNSVFQRNSAAGIGGAIATVGENQTTLEINNCIFYQNAAVTGAGLYHNAGSAKIINSLFTDQRTNGGRGAVDGRPVEVSNSILWKHDFGGVSGATLLADEATVSNSLVEGGHAGTGNINTNPLFFNISDAVGLDKIWGTADDGLRLSSNSPALNAGNNAKIPAGITTDITGNARIVNGTVDMGPYERPLLDPLPVSFDKFTALLQDNHVKLDWNTHSEQNNEAFIIYHSTDGVAYTEIAKQASKGNGANHYTALHSTPAHGINYYRLKQQDFDGTVTTLDDQAVNFSLQSIAVKAWPNPVTRILKIAFMPNQYQQIKLIDINGKILQELAIGTKDYETALDMGSYPKGIYILALSGNNGRQFLKILK